MANGLRDGKGLYDVDGINGESGMWLWALTAELTPAILLSDPKPKANAGLL
jgi:hypothetical protein